jgi:hypothetical protein
VEYARDVTPVGSDQQALAHIAFVWRANQNLVNMHPHALAG